MTRACLLRRLAGDRRGATIVEFGIVAGPFVLMMLAMFDLAYREYVGIQLQGALAQASRQVTVGTSTTLTQLTNLVTVQVKRVAPRATVVVTPSSYRTFSSVGKPEPITTDTAPLGSYNTGDCFLDLNGNGGWDADAGNVNTTGGSDDIVYYTATASYPALVPLGRFLGFPATETVTGTTLLKNQPYASQPDAAVVCT